MASRIFGFTALAYSIWLFAIAVAHHLFDSIPLLALIVQWIDGIPGGFNVTSASVAVACFCPFVVDITRMGLNTGDGEPPPGYERRHRELSAACMWYPAIYYLCFAPVVISWAAFAAGLQLGHPFYMFGAGMCCLSGLWFLLVHETANDLFTNSDPSPQLLDRRNP